ncbi:TetR/AcrR family transcriptional regulator [Fulvivirgaceae bacterium BMA10]|uniref:TetR/AcrR family transcriptional regulator n=1 Tax=Splendidivirga corallicola TaxID=3051826 RepID=A0ABT8KR24_9BACT|nr:TetR/AcrR family transcriptional regulator [Fulvivirgaceae bacterium BMA10]
MEEELLSKAEKTKRYIIERSAQLFNQKGYVGTSMSDIMDVTGLTKGGIYGNFKSKDEIALAAFDYNMEVLYEVFRGAIEVQKSSVDRLHTVLGFHKSIIYHPLFHGGCPILNTSIEADDTHPELKLKVIEALNVWRTSIIKIIERGKLRGEMKEDIKSEKYANVFIAAIEGGLMMSKAYQNNKYLNDTFEHIKSVIKNELEV